jgi:excisionase family DNA binding protein
MEAAIEVDWAIAPPVVAASDDLGLEASQRQRTIGQNVHEVPNARTSNRGCEATVSGVEYVVAGTVARGRPSRQGQGPVPEHWPRRASRRVSNLESRHRRNSSDRRHTAKVDGIGKLEASGNVRDERPWLKLRDAASVRGAGLVRVVPLRERRHGRSFRWPTSDAQPYSCVMSTTAHERSELLHVKQAARELDVHESTIRRAIRSGELAAVTLGAHGRYRIRRRDLEEFLHPVEERP